MWLYSSVKDTRRSAICKDLEGTILPADDPYWDTHTPQMHHGCRSSLRSLTQEQADRKLASDAKTVDGRKRFRDKPPAGVDADEGFGDAPDPRQKAAAQFDLAGLDKGLRESLERKARAAGEAA
jgi:uncharacterized protein with gpF-like domain